MHVFHHPQTTSGSSYVTLASDKSYEEILLSSKGPNVASRKLRVRAGGYSPQSLSYGKSESGNILVSVVIAEEMLAAADLLLQMLNFIPLRLVGFNELVETLLFGHLASLGL